MIYRISFALIITIFSLHPYAEVMDIHRNTSKKILILIHSRTGNTIAAAENIKAGIEKNGTIKAVIKRVPSFLLMPSDSEIVAQLPVVTMEELGTYDGIVFGSPVYFFSPAAEMLAFLQGGMELWKNQTLKNKLTGVFFTSNGNGVNSAEDTLIATLRALYMDTYTLKNICNLASHDISNDLTKYGECLERAFTGVMSSQISEIELPPVPEPVGLYKPYVISGNLIYINQIALKDGKIEYPGVIGVDLDDEHAMASTRHCMLNVLSVLHKAVGGDFSRVKQIIQISGYMNAKDGYVNHSMILNEASKVAVEVLGETRGIATRAAFGVSSLPLNSPIEIQAIIEIQ